ncbi:aldo/keto reductase [Halovulum dunhuangense]|uniref:Aldo/keto reductase n=1 Tax=Halovulum dunhuangense TaxID=1505036 RepID=A0A849L3B8_9RHOB|nr:aldo/keto reductase [Halovulum dunhuangense]NNU80687.1 aldo/keto reductase [Halovulum dunhuangense]
MKQNPLGRTGLTVPEICLGTMTWGSQNTEAEAFAQMDYAMDHRVNFFDTAELYATVPVTPETQGLTEEIIGNWFARTGRRNEVILASKMAGGGTKHIREGRPILPEDIPTAIEGSLKRLRTDRIDLYQMHWPMRGHYHFRKMWAYDPSHQDSAAVRQNIADVLGVLADEVRKGRILHIGLSNDTAWGVMQYLNEAERAGGPRVASIQNEYSLLYRNFDTDLAEVAHHEDVGLLAYTPLAAGLLTGKYSGGQVPADSRATINKGLAGRITPQSLAASDAYVALARAHGLDPAQLALAFCMSRPFMTSVIIGATKMDQLATAIGAADVTLGDEVLQGIADLHKAYPQPY